MSKVHKIQTTNVVSTDVLRSIHSSIESEMDRMLEATGGEGGRDFMPEETVVWTALVDLNRRLNTLNLPQIEENMQREDAHQFSKE